MKGIGSFVLNIAVALYLFANGILGITNQGGSEFGKMVVTILGTGNLTNILTVVLSVCAIIAGLFLMLKFFNVNVRITDVIIFIFIIVWVIFIVIIDVIYPIQKGIELLSYMKQLASHLMVFGALLLSSNRFSR